MMPVTKAEVSKLPTISRQAYTWGISLVAALGGRLFGAMLRRIEALPPASMNIDENEDPKIQK
jgi:hypothetical protein